VSGDWRGRDEAQRNADEEAAHGPS
jgi:hypothetical protein